jgi:uracil-DNA glycosylase family 4
MKGFFNNSQLISKSKDTRKSAPLCGKCGLNNECENPKVKPYGNCEKDLMLLTEMPGAREDRFGEPLSDKPDKFLKRKMQRLFDIDIDTDCIKHNAINCRPEKGRFPKAEEVKCCRPYILTTIDKYKPKVILLFGEQAVRSIIGHRWKKDLGGITKWRGWAIPDKDFKCWIVPTFKPSYITHEKTPKVAEKIFEDDLNVAVKLLDKPLPNFIHTDEEERIQILKHPEQIDSYLDKLIYGDTTLIAFDYEATGRKPHKQGHQLYTAAISENPFHATAFKLFPEIQPKFKTLLECQHIKKIVHNLNYEKMWSKVLLDAELNGIFMDTMLTSHCIDNRSGITSLKFQAYVNFGVCDYDSHLSEYMKAERGNDFNRILEAPIKEVLIYNGMDSMFTMRLGIVHMINMGITNYGIKYDPKATTNPQKEFKKIYKAIESFS